MEAVARMYLRSLKENYPAGPHLVVSWNHCSSLVRQTLDTEGKNATYICQVFLVAHGGP